MSLSPAWRRRVVVVVPASTACARPVVLHTDTVRVGLVVKLKHASLYPFAISMPAGELFVCYLCWIELCVGRYSCKEKKNVDGVVARLLDLEASI